MYICLINIAYIKVSTSIYLSKKKNSKAFLNIFSTHPHLCVINFAAAPLAVQSTAKALAQLGRCTARSARRSAIVSNNLVFSRNIVISQFFF